MTAIQATLISLFNRDLNRLIKEIESYTNEANLWTVEGDITNSGGNLALHLVGNLNTFIGATIGETGYVRQRDLEFSQKDVPRDQLIKMVQETKNIVEEALSEMDSNLLLETYPILVFKAPQTYQHFLVHLATHLGYHLGQVNYHRRLLDQ